MKSHLESQLFDLIHKIKTNLNLDINKFSDQDLKLISQYILTRRSLIIEIDQNKLKEEATKRANEKKAKIEAINNIFEEFEKRVGFKNSALLTKIENFFVYGYSLRDKERKILAEANIHYLGDIVAKSKKQLRNIPGIGRGTIKAIKDVMNKSEIYPFCDMSFWPPSNLEELADEFSNLQQDAYYNIRTILQEYK